MNRRPALTALTTTIALASLAACSTVDDARSPLDDSTTTTSGAPKAEYDAFDDCDALIDWAKEEMLKRVGPYGLDGGWYPYPVAVAEDGAVGAPTASVEGAPKDAGAPVSPNTSETNTQEAGVDEGDIVETDGRFVYTVIDGILRSSDLQTNSVVSEISVPNGDAQMVLFDDRLLVATQTWSAANDAVVDVYQIDRGELTLVQRDHLEGYIGTVRSVDGVVRVVLTTNVTSRLDFVYPRDGSEDALDAAEKRNREVVEALTADDLIPRRFEESALGQWDDPEAAIDCSALGYPGEFAGFGTTWLATVDLDAPDPKATGSVGIVADGGVVYTSPNTLYVTSTRWFDPADEDVVPANPEPPTTAIHAFDISDGAATYRGSGSVEGTVINSYALSEFDGRLRIATTSSASGFGTGIDNGVHVFEMSDGELVEVGAVRGLGRGETIQGVRYDGARGYVVTFRQVDPLYVLDLSDPTSPAVVGELKIPGFSTYLHPIDGDRLIGVGMSGDSNGMITGVQVSVFDVSDPSEPDLIATAPIGGWSEAVYDPHAFLWWSATGSIVIPKGIECSTIGGPGCESAVVLKLADDSLTEQGRLFQWSPIRRAVVAEGRLVTASAIGLVVNSLDDLSTVGEVKFVD